MISGLIFDRLLENMNILAKYLDDEMSARVEYLNSGMFGYYILAD